MGYLGIILTAEIQINHLLWEKPIVSQHKILIIQKDIPYPKVSFDWSNYPNNTKEVQMDNNYWKTGGVVCEFEVYFLRQNIEFSNSHGFWKLRKVLKY